MADGYAKPVLVESEWVAEHKDDDNVVVAEVDENTDLYDKRARCMVGGRDGIC